MAIAGPLLPATTPAPTNVLAYGVLGLPLAFAALPIYVHIPRFYAEAKGVDLALVGGILLGVRLFDALIDPWLGWLADRLSRPRMLTLALLPFGLGFIVLLHPPAAFAPLWLAGALLLTYCGFSAASVAYQAWGASAPDSMARTRLTAAREGFGLVGVVLAAMLPGLLSSDLNIGTARLAWVLPPLLLLAAAITLSGARPGRSIHDFTKAHNPPPNAATADSLRASLRRVVRYPRYRRLLAVFVANGVAAALPATLFLFFVADVLAASAASGVLLALYFVAGACSVPVWAKLAERCGRVQAWLWSMLLAAVAFAGAGLLGTGDVILFGVICVASGLALGADLTLPAAIAADLGARQQQAGACFGVWNFFAKLNLALAAGLALPLLDLLGYRPGFSAGTGALTFAYVLLPLVFKLIAAALLWRWRDSLEVSS